MAFETFALAGRMVLVRGSDKTGTNGETVLDGNQWAEVKALKTVSAAQADFDQVFSDFYAPITAATEALAAEATKTVEIDELYIEIIEEGEDGSASNPGLQVHLTADSALLKLIDSGNTDRLIWVGDKLEILAA